MWERSLSVPEIGIVVLNYNNWEDTAECLESIRKNPPRASHVIFLIDNASTVPKTAGIEEIIREGEVIYVQNEENLGYNGGNNAGIRKALESGCQGIVLANNDVRFTPGCIDILWEYAQNHPGVGIVGPKILDGDGKIQRSNLCRKTGMREKYLVRTRLHAVFRGSYRSYFGLDRDYDSTFSVYAVLGCCLLLTRECAEAVTPFDEYPLLYEEELMLGIRMEQQGWGTVYHGEAVVVHLHGNSTRRVRAFSYAHNIRSEIYYCRAYLSMKKWQILPLFWYRAGLYLVRCLAHRDFRKYWGSFVQMSREELKKC